MIRAAWIAFGTALLGLSAPDAWSAVQTATPPAAVDPADASAAALTTDPVPPVEPGGVFVLRARAAAGADALVASILGRDVAFARPDPAGPWEALVGVDLDVAPGAHPWTIRAERRGAVVARGDGTLTVTPKQFTTRRLRVAPRFVDPPPDEVARITREAALLTDLFERSTPRRWQGPFVLPVPATPTSNFGTRSVFNGQARSPHAGVDFGGAVGTPIRAANAGTVVLAEPLYFTGHTVVIDHGLGLYTLYAHLSRLDVAGGQPIATGQILGLLGATGRVTGPHLHWSVRLGAARVDPLALVAALRTAPAGPTPAARPVAGPRSTPAAGARTRATAAQKRP